MKKHQITIIFFLVIAALASSVYQYIAIMKTEVAGATQTIPSPGHSWSQMESGPDSIQVSGRTITNLAAPVNSTDASNKAYVDAASGSSCVDNYGNLCLNGGGLSFTYNGKALHIDAFPRGVLRNTSGSTAGQTLAWEQCERIGARLSTQAEWQAACSALSGPEGNGLTTFGGGKTIRYEWTATPSSATDTVVRAGGGSCSGTTEAADWDYGILWFRCVR